MIPWRRAWQPTPVILPGESHGQRTLRGYSPQGHKDLDMTEVTEHTPMHGGEETATEVRRTHLKKDQRYAIRKTKRLQKYLQGNIQWAEGRDFS